MATKRAATCLDSKQKHKIVEQNRRHKVSAQHDCADCPGTLLCGQKRAYFNELRTAADEDGMEADMKLTDTKILERSIRFMQKYENDDKFDEPSGSGTCVYTDMCELIAKVYEESYDRTRYEFKTFRVLSVLWVHSGWKTQLDKSSCFLVGCTLLLQTDPNVSATFHHV